jgi:hypothetical protein
LFLCESANGRTRTKKKQTPRDKDDKQQIKMNSMALSPSVPTSPPTVKRRPLPWNQTVTPSEKVQASKPSILNMTTSVRQSVLNPYLSATNTGRLAQTSWRLSRMYAAPRWLTTWVSPRYIAGTPSTVHLTILEAKTEQDVRKQLVTRILHSQDKLTNLQPTNAEYEKALSDLQSEVKQALIELGFMESASRHSIPYSVALQEWYDAMSNMESGYESDNDQDNDALRRMLQKESHKYDENTYDENRALANASIIEVQRAIDSIQINPVDKVVGIEYHF